MNIINKSKIAFVVLFAINAMNTQLFAADAHQQIQAKGFIEKLKIGAIAALVTVGFTVSPIMADPTEDTYKALVCSRTLDMAAGVCAGLDCPWAERERAEAHAKLCDAYYRKLDLQEDPFRI